MDNRIVDVPTGRFAEICTEGPVWVTNVGRTKIIMGPPGVTPTDGNHVVPNQTVLAPWRTPVWAIATDSASQALLSPQPLDPDTHPQRIAGVLAAQQEAQQGTTG
jgi:hypothetical protein